MNNGKVVMSATRIVGISLGLAFGAETAVAASIADTYATGDTLTAAKMTTIKNAVNDNDTRVTAVEGSRSGVEFSESTTYLSVNAVATVAENKASVAVSAPTAGYIVASYSAITYFNHTTGTDHYIRVVLTTSSTPSVSGSPSFRYMHVAGTEPTDVYFLGPIATQRVFQVAAGTTTIYLHADSNLAGANAQLGYGDLTAIFVPNRY